MMKQVVIQRLDILNFNDEKAIGNVRPHLGCDLWGSSWLPL